MWQLAMLPRTRLLGGEGKRGAAAANETTVPLRGDVSFVDEASQTTVWRIVTKKARAKRGPRLQTQPQDGRCGHPLCRKKLCGRLWGMSPPTRPREKGTGLSQGVSLLWTRPRPQKGGEWGPAAVIRRDDSG